MGATQILSPPYKGQNDQFPVISIQNPNCERMENFNNKLGTLNLRKGHDYFAALASTNQGLNVTSYATAFNPTLLLMVDNIVGGTSELRWYDITTGVPVLVHTRVGSGGDDEIHTLYFNGYLFYMGEFSLSASPEYYNGTTWGTAGYTWPSSFNPFGGCVYKNRAYFAGRQSAEYAYTGIDAITGATTGVDLGSIINSPADLFGIRSISTTQSVKPDNVLAFLFSNGEILVYYGGPYGYPDAPGWGSISHFQVSEMIYNNTFIDAKGDTFIFTKSEILSLRNLFLSGYDSERKMGIGAAIQRRWSQIVQGLAAYSSDIPTFIKGIYDDKNDRLVINLPFWVDPVTGAAVASSSGQLIYDFILNGWYEYYQIYGTASSLSLSICYHDGDLYNLVDKTPATFTTVVWKLDSLATYIDDNITGAAAIGIPYKMRSAPLPIAKFGANSISGVEAICKSDLYPQTNYKFVADLGRAESASQVLPAQGTTITKPMMNVGIQDAITSQLEISGTSVSCSVGLEISAFNVWFNQGEAQSR